jgi:HlyD family secretion protein
MKRVIVLFVVLLLIGVGVAVGVPKARAYWKKRNEPKFQFAKVKRGDMTLEVRTSGTVEPILRVQIGSFVSGPIVKLEVDYNEKVTEGQLLAKVDPRLYAAAVLRDEAAWATAKAEVARVTAQLQQADNDERRALHLRDINPDYISDTEMDQFKYTRQALEAGLLIAEQSVKQAEARLKDSQLNLEYTDIVAPRSGIIIDRKIDPGQTLTASFQTPELFVLAPDMDERMWVHASVIEADIGRILKAQKEKRPVYFSVDAYERELFEGVIQQIRTNSSTEQSVVTYPVIVETPNPDMKLLPGMTAELSFEIEKRQDVLKLPSAAVRFVPDVKLVREEDKKLLEGDDEPEEEVDSVSAKDRVEAYRKSRQRHVWVKEGEKLKAIKIEFGIFADSYYELVSGDLEESQELVTEVE